MEDAHRMYLAIVLSVPVHVGAAAFLVIVRAIEAGCFSALFRSDCSCQWYCILCAQKTLNNSMN